MKVSNERSCMMITSQRQRLSFEACETCVCIGVLGEQARNAAKRPFISAEDEKLQ